MGLTYLFIFVLEDELDTPAYTEDFQEVEVKDEPIEYDAVSCDLFYHPNSMLFFIIFSIIYIINYLFTRSGYYLYCEYNFIFHYS